jgi:hypothetical protein
VSLLYNPTARLVWAAGSAAVTAACVAADWRLREQTGSSFMAPSVVALDLSIVLGAVLGVAGSLWERYLFRHQREFLLAFHRAPLGERLRWVYQRRNLLLNGWCGPTTHRGGFSDNAS